MSQDVRTEDQLPGLTRSAVSKVIGHAQLVLALPLRGRVQRCVRYTNGRFRIRDMGTISVLNEQGHMTQAAMQQAFRERTRTIQLKELKSRSSGPFRA